MSAGSPAPLSPMRRTGHVCWVVQEPGGYVSMAAQMLEEGTARGLKPLAFGPAGSADLAALAPHAVAVLDPAQAFLGGGELDASLMLAAFREQTALARADGYLGLCAVADMTWLLATGAAWQQVVAFEAQLESVVHELGATVVCAYRSADLDADMVRGARCVHGLDHGSDGPPFRLTCRGDRWVLAGEVDFTSAGLLAAGLTGAQKRSALTVDVSGLEFLDVAGMRALARAAGTRSPLVLPGATTWLRRLWSLSGFDVAAPGVRLV